MARRIAAVAPEYLCEIVLQRTVALKGSKSCLRLAAREFSASPQNWGDCKDPAAAVRAKLVRGTNRARR